MRKKQEYKTFEDVPKSWLDRCSGDGYEKYIDEDGNRRYKDNNVKVGEMPFRPCARCGHYPNENGDDYCIQNLGRVVNACCGHGKHEGYIMFEDGRTIRGYFKVYDKHNNELKWDGDSNTRHTN